MIRDVPTMLLLTLPDARRHEPQIRQEVARLAMKSLAVALLDALSGDGDHPAFVPNQNLTLNFPMPNADTVYRTARITPGGTYRLRGSHGNLTLASLVQIGTQPAKSDQTAAPARSARSNLNLNDLHVDRDGCFDLILSPERPSGHAGDWWPLNESSNLLLLRLVSADWESERDPRISIDRMDRPVRLVRPSAEKLESVLRAIPQAVVALPMRFVAHTEKLRAKGMVNRLEAYDLSQSGGFQGQSYYEGAFDIEENDALLMEVKVPDDCTYWSVILGDELHQTLDWANNHSSLNSAQGKIDNDGLLRFVIADKDPGIPNWLDTAGHLQGVVQGRWFGSTFHPVPSIRKVRFDELRSMIPHDTPMVTSAQRETALRERRSVVQLRALW